MRPFPLRYTNNKGEYIDFAEDGFSYDSLDLFSSSWEYETSKNKVRRWTKKPTELKLEAWINTFLAEDGFKKRDKMLSVAEQDIKDNKPGKFTFRGWTIDGFIFENKKTDYLLFGEYTKANLTVLLPDPNWYRDHTYQFYIDATPVGGEWLDYPYDYPYDYKAMPPARSLTNPSTFATEFTLTVFGPAKNPTIQIGQNTYQVMYEIARGDRLVIDSRKREIYVIEVTGRVVDVFGYRKKGSVGSGSYIFEKIPTGYSNVVIDNSFGFDLTIHEEGSVPRWS